MPHETQLHAFRDSRGLAVPRWPETILPSTTIIIWHPTVPDMVFCHRRADNGYWGFVGGAQEPGESILDCARRETYEETGWHVTLEQLVCVDSDPCQGAICVYADTVIHYTNLTFTARLPAHDPSLRDGPILSPESTSWGWFTPEQLPQPFLPRHTLRLLQALRCAGEVLVL
jgi:ADP-ribose pyrophosphatase YjhB (NUDIX family)